MAATYLMCFVCGRKFGSSSLLIHQKTCRSTHELQQAKIPAEFRKVLPPTPPIPKKVTRKSAERFNEQVYELYRSCLMHSCAGCNRSFSDYKKLIAHRDRCDRLKWLNNPLSAGAGAGGGAVAGAGGGGVLSWKDRKASSGSAGNSSNVREYREYRDGDRGSVHFQDMSSSFDDSNLSSSPTSIEDSPRSSGSDEARGRGSRWGVAAVGSSRRAAAVALEQERQEQLERERQEEEEEEQEQQRQKEELVQRKKQEEMRKRRQRERERQRLQQNREAKPLNLSASGSLLFQQAFENGSGEASLLEEPDAPAIPAAASSSKGGPALLLPGQKQNVAMVASVLSPEVEEARREYHRRRLQLKVARANSPQSKHAAPPPIPAAAVSRDNNNSTPATSTGTAAIEEDSPEARATMARLKAMYRKRRAKLQSS